MRDKERMKIALDALDKNLEMLEEDPTCSRILDDVKDAACIVAKLCMTMDSQSYMKHSKEMTA